MRERNSVLTAPWPAKAREADAVETPAARATSRKVLVSGNGLSISVINAAQREQLRDFSGRDVDAHVTQVTTSPGCGLEACSGYVIGCR
jgi:hypothetical protein